MFLRSILDPDIGGIAYPLEEAFPKGKECKIENPSRP
jgi:hypothetical protein